MRINRLRRRELIILLGGSVATSVAWPLAARTAGGQAADISRSSGDAEN
jgi:hypothetical protein